MTANMAMPGSLKWDGVVGDRECLIISEEPMDEGITMRQAFVHVSDYVPEILALMMEGAPAEERILPVLLSTYGEGAGEMQVQVADDMFIMGEAFLYVPTDGYSLEGFVFPKKGWYFMSVSVIMGDIEFPMMYVNGLQILGLSFPDTNGGGSADKYFETKKTETTVTELGDTLTWDGVSGENIGAAFGITLVRVADCDLTLEELQAATITVTSNTNNVGDQFVGTMEGIVMISDSNNSGAAYVTYTDNLNVNGIVFPTAGIYFQNAENSYYTSLTIAGYNFINTISTTQTVIKTEHLPEALRFGEMTTETHGDTLTWDSNTEGLANIENAVFKVSDAVPTLDDIHRGFSFTISDNNGNKVSTVPIPVETASEITMNDSGIISYSNYVYVLTQSITESDVTYPIGVYLRRDENYYISSLTINGYNGFVSTETKVVKIDPKYLPDDISGGGSGSGLPEVSADDNGKSVSVVDGEWIVKKPSYNDLSDKPTLFSGSYNDLSDKPMLDTQMSDTSTNMVQNKVIKAYIDAAIGAAIAASY